MPPLQTPLNLKILRLIKNKKEFKLDNGKLLCTVCSEKINFTHQHGKERLEKHESSKKHHNNLHQNNGPKDQTSVINLYQKESENEKRRKQFNLDLTEAFITANIALVKLENEKLREFLFKYTKINIPKPDFLRCNYLNDIYGSKISKIREIVDENSFFL